MLWKGFVKHHIPCHDMGTHLMDDPPKEGKEKWLKEDDRFLNQILNSIENHEQDLVRHWTMVKYLGSLYARKQNSFHVYN